MKTHRKREESIENLDFSGLLPPLSTEEFASLRASIEAEGVRDPVLKDENGNVLDGHHRLAIDPDAPVRVIPGSGGWSLARRRAFVYQANYVRRNLSPEQKYTVNESRRDVARALYAETDGDGRRVHEQGEIGAMLGATQQAISLWVKDGAATGTSTSSCTITGSPAPDSSPARPRHTRIDHADRKDIFERWQAGETQAQIAADFGASERRVRQICAQEKAREEDRGADKPDHTPDLPQKTYRCIVIDPPWPMAKSERAPRPTQGPRLSYHTMTVNDIAALPVASLVDPAGCHLYLWVTHRFLPDGLRLLEAWGFTYHCLLTWVKPTGMTPYSWMFNTEHVLFGYAGKFTAGKQGLKVAFEAPAGRGKHSTKPDVFFERVEQFSVGPRLEMCARKLRPGFEGWGNELS